jgi:hypothetical protein
MLDRDLSHLRFGEHFGQTGIGRLIGQVSIFE